MRQLASICVGQCMMVSSPELPKPVNSVTASSRPAGELAPQWKTK